MSSSELRALVVEQATLLEGAEVVTVDGSLELRLDGEQFAALSGATAHLRLRPEVAAAALRTPDVAPSPRGPGWVRFGPPVLDGFARDRLLAWLESAWRLADEAGPGPPPAPPHGPPPAP